MISFHDAYRILFDAAVNYGTERCELLASLNRILAEDIVSDIFMPPFDKSAMDGYACRRQDLQEVLSVVEIIPAGKVPEKHIAAGQCAQIMTGAPVPEGANCVVMVEHSKLINTHQIQVEQISTADNICKKGEDVKRGQRVLSRGAQITAAHIAILASVGASSPLVYKQARVAVLSTGNELIEPWEKPDLAQIRNSNAYQLCSQLMSMGINGKNLGIVKDTLEDTVNRLEEAFSSHDVVLISGAVSKGDYDFVPEALQKLGFETLVRSVAMQPGKPLHFAKRDTQYCIALPGNPVSTFVVFEIIVKAFLYKLSGHTEKPQNITAILDTDFYRKKTERQLCVPVRFIRPGYIVPNEYHGSAHIHALSSADGLLTIPVGVSEITKGEQVCVRLL